MITKESPVTALNGCGKKRGELLKQLGIVTVNDLIRHFPRGYQHRGDIKNICDKELGTTGAFVLTVSSAPLTVRISGGRTLTKCKAFDGDRSCTLVFFNRNYIKDILYTGYTYRFWGKLVRGKNGYELSPSVIEPVSEIKKLNNFVPLYPLTKGITQNFIRTLIVTALDAIKPLTTDFFPGNLRERLGICTEYEALVCVHTPENEDMIKKGRDYFITEELFMFACSVTVAKQGRTLVRSKKMYSENSKLYEFTAALPFRLTGAQSRVISEIRRDLTGIYPMARLVSGDVGSGKTVCAMAAAYIAVKNGYQCAMMAPTEILAMQHYRDFKNLFDKLGIECGYLTGSTPVQIKRETVEKLKSGQLKMVIGTHALLSDTVVFNDLGLVITDEQHRFGVMQRTELQTKGGYPHVLVMSATPIPRTLALILMGDLDISVVDELPPGRQSVDTFVVGEEHRKRMNGFIAKQVKSGHQVYIVCPSVESKEEETEEDTEEDIIRFEFDRSEEKVPRLKSAVEYERNLREKIFPDFRTALIHGKMSGKEKDEIMKRFALGEIDILVSTTVIEVGVNVPNAILMIVENAERFGLSQLHQLRGRVGRGSDKSYCILVSDAKGENARKRLEIMRTVKDGYKIAKYDLDIRGPGDFISASAPGKMSARQHGALNFRFAGLCTDSLLLEKVFKIASEIIEPDPGLENPENEYIRKAILKSGLNTRALN